MARHRILVVDDEDNLRDVLVEVLKRDGHEVDSAADGAEGVRRAEAHRYDLVITDLRMPGLEGPALYEAVRRRYPDDPPRVIFMSANTGIEEYARFLLEPASPPSRSRSIWPTCARSCCRFSRRSVGVDGSAGRC